MYQHINANWKLWTVNTLQKTKKKGQTPNTVQVLMPYLVVVAPRILTSSPVDKGTEPLWGAETSSERQELKEAKFSFANLYPNTLKVPAKSQT